MKLRRHRFFHRMVLAVALLPAALAGLKSFSGAPCACHPHSCVCPHNHHAAAPPHCRFPDGRPQSDAPCVMRCDTGIEPVVVAHPFLLPAPVPAAQPLAETALPPAGPTEAVLFIPEPHSPPPRPC